MHKSVDVETGELETWKRGNWTAANMIETLDNRVDRKKVENLDNELDSRVVDQI